MGRISNLPRIGELMYGLNSKLFRRLALETTFLHNKQIITEEYFENATRFHKIKGTTEVMLYITRKQFFDTLFEEIMKLGFKNIPILIVWGKEEKSIPLSKGEEMHRILKGSRLEILDQAGHCANDDQSELFNKLALDFLTPPNNAS